MRWALDYPLALRKLVHEARRQGGARDRTRQARDRANRVILVGENDHYKPLCVTLRRLLADDAIGEMVFAQFSTVALRLKSADDWRNDESMAGGDAFFEEGIHWRPQVGQRHRRAHRPQLHHHLLLGPDHVRLQRADAALVHVLDELVVVGLAEGEILVPAERRNGDDGGLQVGERDRSGFHVGGAKERRGESVQMLSR
mgnify:CR=1 FL=1